MEPESLTVRRRLESVAHLLGDPVITLGAAILAAAGMPVPSALLAGLKVASGLGRPLSPTEKLAHRKAQDQETERARFASQRIDLVGEPWASTVEKYVLQFLLESDPDAIRVQAFDNNLKAYLQRLAGARSSRLKDPRANSAQWDYLDSYLGLVADQITVLVLMDPQLVLTHTAAIRDSRSTSRRLQNSVARLDSEMAALAAPPRVDEVLWWPARRADELDLVAGGPQLGSWLADNDLPDYVARDFDAVLDERLALAAVGGGFLVLVGDPKAGKTRSLLQALARTMGERRVWAPNPHASEPLSVLAAHVNGPHADTDAHTIVIVLDDLHQYLATGRGLLSDHELDALTAAGVVVTATLHQETLARLEDSRGNESLLRYRRVR